MKAFYKAVISYCPKIVFKTMEAEKRSRGGQFKNYFEVASLL